MRSLTLMGTVWIAVICGCKQRDAESTDLSQLGPTMLAECHVSHGLQDGFRVCIDSSDADPAMVSRIEGYIQAGIEAWVGAVRPLDESVSDEVRFSCERSHISVFLTEPGEDGFAGCGVMSVPPYVDTEVATTNDPSLQGRILYQLGVVVAGLAPQPNEGECEGDKAQAVMCSEGQDAPVDDERLHTLHAADIEAYQKQFQIWDEDGRRLPPLPEESLATDEDAATE